LINSLVEIYEGERALWGIGLTASNHFQTTSAYTITIKIFHRNIGIIHGLVEALFWASGTSDGARQFSPYRKKDFL